MLPGTSSWLLARLLGGIVKSDAAKSAEAQTALLEALLPRGADRLLLKAIPGSVWHQPGVPQARLPFSIMLDD
jgi:hypothetical protein